MLKNWIIFDIVRAVPGFNIGGISCIKSALDYLEFIIFMCDHHHHAPSGDTKFFRLGSAYPECHKAAVLDSSIRSSIFTLLILNLPDSLNNSNCISVSHWEMLLKSLKKGSVVSFLIGANRLWSAICNNSESKLVTVGIIRTLIGNKS